MVNRCRSLACAAALLGLLSAAPAAATRATCEELLTALDTGQPIEAVAQAYATTQARLEACQQLARQRERFAERRDRFDLQRAERGLGH